MIKLSRQQELFAQGIAKGKTQSDAYREAYPTCVSWPDKTVWSKASTLANDGRVAGRVAELQAPAMKKLDTSIERIILERARLATYDIGDIAGHRLTCPADIATLPADVRQAITGWKWDKEGNFIVTMADKNAHLGALEKINGMYRDDDTKANPLSIHIHLG